MPFPIGATMCLRRTTSLKSLSEVEAFIEQNKHLPEIPSAVEVETEGIQVSEMLQLMMKKIEELTLYTIEQEKRIKELEKSQVSMKAHTQILGGIGVFSTTTYSQAQNRYH